MSGSEEHEDQEFVKFNYVEFFKKIGISLVLYFIAIFIKLQISYVYLDDRINIVRLITYCLCLIFISFSFLYFIFLTIFYIYKYIKANLKFYKFVLKEYFYPTTSKNEKYDINFVEEVLNQNSKSKTKERENDRTQRYSAASSIYKNKETNQPLNHEIFTFKKKLEGEAKSINLENINYSGLKIINNNNNYSQPTQNISNSQNLRSNNQISNSLINACISEKSIFNNTASFTNKNISNTHVHGLDNKYSSNYIDSFSNKYCEETNLGKILSMIFSNKMYYSEILKEPSSELIEKYNIINEKEFEKLLNNELGINSYIESFSKCVSNLKNCIYENIIPNTLDYHGRNLENLNRELNEMGIIITDDIKEANLDLVLIKKRLSEIESFILGEKTIEHNISIFYGDNECIEELIEFLSKKSTTFQKMKEYSINPEFIENKENKINEGNRNKNSVENIKNRGSLTNENIYLLNRMTLNSNYSPTKLNNNNNKTYGRIDNFNTFKNQNISEYNPLLCSTLYSLEEKKEKLIYKISICKDLLFTRLKINKNLTIDKSILHENKKHLCILLDYNIRRLKELSRSSFKFNSGGKYIEYNWISFFPTDSELIGWLLTMNLSVLIEPNSIHNRFFYKNTESGNNSDTFLSQTNLNDEETNFCISHKSKLIKVHYVRINFFILGK